MNSPLFKMLREPLGYAPRDPGTAALVVAGVGAASSVMQGISASNAASYNADIARRNAVIAQQQAEADAEAQQRQALQQIGRARAGYGASGVTSDGSALDVLASSASLAELDRQNILYKGKLRAMGYSDQASLDDTSASNYLLQGVLGAGTAAGKGYLKYSDLSGGGSAPNTPSSVDDQADLLGP